jgi:hypothetical protein
MGAMPDPTRRDEVSAQGAARTSYEYRRFWLPRTTSRSAARQLLTDHAEYGQWELARLRLYPDGRRHVTLRRRIMRMVRTLSVPR